MKNYTITVNGNVYDVVVEEGASAGASVAAPRAAAAPAVPKAAAPKAAGGAGSVKIEAGAAGKVFKVEAKVGQTVKPGDPVVILEAMKMENEIMCPCDGKVAYIHASKGTAVESGTLLCVIQ